MNRVAIIDNFDSFVYNIAQYVGETGAQVNVLRNNVSMDSVLGLEPDRIILSPGPGHPRDSGVTLDVLREADVPILGICLGHQAIGYVFGAEVVRSGNPLHGKTSTITHDGQGIFRGLESPLQATRYHSLVVDPRTIPEQLTVNATAEDGTVMAISHIERPIVGVQFHPESILTRGGRRMLRNFLEM